MFYNAPKLESQKSKYLSKHFHKSNLTAPKIFSIFIFRPSPFIVIKIQIIISEHVKYEHLSPKGKKMGAETKFVLKINIFFNVF